jgi:hypothetical protein
MEQCHEMQGFARKCYKKMLFWTFFQGFPITVNQGVLGSSPRGGALKMSRLRE